MKRDINWHDDVTVTTVVTNNYDFRKQPLDTRMHNTMETTGNFLYNEILLGHLLNQRLLTELLHTKKTPITKLAAQQ